MTSWPDEPRDDSRPLSQLLWFEILARCLCLKIVRLTKMSDFANLSTRGLSPRPLTFRKEPGKDAVHQGQRQSSMATYSQPSTRQLCRLLVDSIHTTDISHTLNVVARFSSTTGSTVLPASSNSTPEMGWMGKLLSSPYLTSRWPLASNSKTGVTVLQSHRQCTHLCWEHTQRMQTIITASRSQHLFVTQKERSKHQRKYQQGRLFF